MAMVSDESSTYGTGKLHINFREEDILVHCTDNPGRTTMLRTSVQQKLKANPQLAPEEAYMLCIRDVISCCNSNHINCLLVKVVNKRSDGIVLLNQAMQVVLEGGIHIYPASSPSSQPSSKTRRLNYNSSRRRYHKDSYSLESYKEVESWRDSK